MYVVIKDIVANRWLIAKVDSGTGIYSTKAETNSQSVAIDLVTELNS